MSALLNLPVSQLDTTSIINSRAPPSRNVPVRDSPRCSWGRTYVSSSPHRWQLQSAANGASASVGTSSEQLTSQPLQLRVRSATEADLPSIANLFGQVSCFPISAPVIWTLHLSAVEPSLDVSIIPDQHLRPVDVDICIC